MQSTSSGNIKRTHSYFFEVVEQKVLLPSFMTIIFSWSPLFGQCFFLNLFYQVPRDPKAYNSLSRPWGDIMMHVGYSYNKRFVPPRYSRYLPHLSWYPPRYWTHIIHGEFTFTMSNNYHRLLSRRNHFSAVTVLCSNSINPIHCN